MQPRLQRLQKVFLRALNAQTPSGRSAVIEQECDHDEELRRWVEQLLAKHDEDNGLLDTPVIDRLPPRLSCAGRTDVEFDEWESGAIIADRYRILDRIGNGGMGAVYRAEQFAPLRRTVAIKLIRPGL